MREEHDPLILDPLQTPSFPSQQDEIVVEEERIGVLDSVALESIEITINVPTTEQVSLKLQTSIGYGRREEVGDKSVQSPTEVYTDDGENTSIIFNGVVSKVPPVISISLRSVSCSEETVAESIHEKSVDGAERIDNQKEARMKFVLTGNRKHDRFVVKFVAMIINGENVMDWDTADVLDYKETWSIKFYSHTKNKLDQGYETSLESAGHNYHDHNNMECSFGKRKGGKCAKKQKH
ncbi:hypothetical protein K7X08_036251 [Anisodus acutangulus]|uniref:Uncharacterized protein n=1 Tax=Anisodus acutangulus TaxID=402998 RepID=A0A9Q1L8A2_9SOLA|nr:hypothetical protein K7X08_036251 [Anisodus acutangulus]